MIGGLGGWTDACEGVTCLARRRSAGRGPRVDAFLDGVPAPEFPELRSDGKHHALARTRDGIVMVSEADGVVGFLASPAGGSAVRWAGFVDDDAVLVAAEGTLFRAATPADAVAGRAERVGSLAPRASLMASAGRWGVVAAPAEGGAFLVSSNSGRTFAGTTRPTGKLTDLTVRSDGAR